jgi:hypothetical protein
MSWLAIQITFQALQRMLQAFQKRAIGSDDVAGTPDDVQTPQKTCQQRQMTK